MQFWRRDSRHYLREYIYIPSVLTMKCGCFLQSAIMHEISYELPWGFVIFSLFLWPAQCNARQCPTKGKYSTEKKGDKETETTQSPQRSKVLIVICYDKRIAINTYDLRQNSFQPTWDHVQVLPQLNPTSHVVLTGPERGLRCRYIVPCYRPAPVCGKDQSGFQRIDNS